MKQTQIGIVEWLRPDERDRVTPLLDELRRIGVRQLRTGISWADWHTPQGQAWYRWLLPTLAERVEVLPCLVYTPPSRGEEPRTNSPPARLDDYADWVGQMIEQFGRHFEWVEIWNEPNNPREWDSTLDPGFDKFAAMAGQAAREAHRLGKKTLLGGLSPIDPNFVSNLHDKGALQHFDAVGVHGFPHSFEFHWPGWEKLITGLRQRLDWCGVRPEIWITETGYSTWRHDEHCQLADFLDAIRAPADRVYWYGLYDLHPDLPTVDGFHSDEREYHFGIKQADGTDKLLARLLRDGGRRAVSGVQNLVEHGVRHEEDATLILGGAGFIGTNLAARVAESGQNVIVYDNLSRPGVEDNLRWLIEHFPEQIEFKCADVRSRFELAGAVARAKQVFHFAAQVAVTSSLERPRHDFDVNARGTMEVVEAVRTSPNKPPLLFTSTNKVYGDLADMRLHLNGQGYEPAERGHASGVDEDRPISFQSPYGCSKGAADQYVLDYARSAGIRAVVFRMSCIYGPHQHGTEDQGWVAHFARAALQRKPVTLYGDGQQVRDLLFVDDLIDAMLLAQEHMPQITGRPFNIGGGPSNAVSLLDVVRRLETVTGQTLPVKHAPWRCGDQRYYVSDTGRFHEATGWRPQTGVSAGLRQLVGFLRHHLDLPAGPRPPKDRMQGATAIHRGVTGGVV